MSETAPISEELEVRASTIDVKTIPDRDAWRGPLLEVRDLTLSFPTDDGLVHAVDNLSFDLGADEVLGIVGESGSGKTVTSLAILGLLPKTAQITGEILFCGRNCLGLKERDMSVLRGD